jgi:putative pre-16S rRNA nuclease
MGHIVAEVGIPSRAYNRHVLRNPTSSQVGGLPRRILGLDVGSKTIGLAISDPLGITAQGLPTIRRKNKRLDFEALEHVIREHQVAEVVVGYPLRMSGAASSQSERISQFAEQLRQRFRIPVRLWDERLTSAEANRVLRDSEMSIKRRAEVVDRLAAVLILQSFMDGRTAGSGH